MQSLQRSETSSSIDERRKQVSKRALVNSSIQNSDSPPQNLNVQTILNLLLDVLLCSIAENCYSLFVFWLALRARQNTAQLVKILSDTTQQNV